MISAHGIFMCVLYESVCVRVVAFQEMQQQNDRRRR